MPDPTPNPFPLSIPEKVNSPALLAYFQQFGIENYLSAEEINQIVQALKWLQENGGSGGGGSVDTSALLTKLSMQEVAYTGGGANQVISLSAASGAGTFRLTNNSLVSLAGFNSGDATLIYNGRILVIFNDTANPVGLIQNSGAAALKYSSVANLVMPSKGIALFKIGADTTKFYLVGKNWEDAPQIDFATQSENEQAATATDIATINNAKATTPRGLRWFWNSLRALAWSWSGKQSFFGGVNMGSLTASRWLRLNVDKDIESFDGQALLDAKQNNSIYITANTTAVNNARYIANGTFTVSDIASPVAGSNYEVVVRGGSVTINSVAYQQGNIIQRIHDGTSWATIVLNQFNVLTVTTSVDIATSVEWNNKIITIDNGSNNINITTNNQLTLAGNKNGGSGIVSFKNGSVTNVLVNGISTLTGTYDTFSIIPRSGFSTNLLYISRQ